MQTNQELLTTIIDQEKELVFLTFTSETAYTLGTSIYNTAKLNNQGITIDIRLGNHVLFHVAMEGTTPNNERWVQRKSNTVQLLHKSSFRVGIENKISGHSLETRQFLSSMEYAEHGGSFPIRIKGSGVIGAITVSGLTQEEDHTLVVDALREFLG